FILILNEPVGAEHLILALNEGAMAVINAPVKPETLLNYVGRGLAAQKEDKARSEDLERLQRVADHEKSCSDEQAMEVGRCKRQLRLNYRLINRLMTTPRAAIGQTRVLLVSDSAYQLELFQKHLENAGLTVLTAPDGLKGLDEARASRPRIIVSDLEMPGLGGLELCREIKNDEALAPNHFIICTASEDKIEDVLKPEHKVDDCLVKPSRPEQFEEFTARVALGLLV
ncbi:MAG: response regulator, partial [Proteobacteria bacterium]|nr:response regulator [Pseudomonadota bacterium]